MKEDRKAKVIKVIDLKMKATRVTDLRVRVIRVIDHRVRDIRVTDLRVKATRATDHKVRVTKVIDHKVKATRVIDHKVRDIRVTDLRVKDIRATDRKVKDTKEIDHKVRAVIKETEHKAVLVPVLVRADSKAEAAMAVRVAIPDLQVVKDQADTQAVDLMIWVRMMMISQATTDHLRAESQVKNLESVRLLISRF